MNFQKHYQTFYENASAEEARHALKESIAQKTFNKKSPSSMKIFTRVAFAVFAVLVSVPLFAPNAFAETVKFAEQTFTLATEKVQVLITRSFDKDHDLFSDEDVTRITDDASVDSVKYTRDEHGEVLEFTQECENGICEQQASGGMEFHIEGVDGIQVKAETSDDESIVTISPVEQEEK